MKNKIIICLVLLTFFSILVLAECPPDCYDSSIFDSGNPESFDYVNGDYSTVTDWSLVDWTRIPPLRIAEVPADKLEYTLLNSEQKQQMEVDQILVNLDKIDNLATEVNKDLAQKALKKEYGITIDLGEGAQIRNKKLTATYGEKDLVTLSGSEYKKGQLKINENGEIIFIPDKELSKLIIPSGDQLTVDTQKSTFEFKGNLIQGKLSFNPESNYLKQGNTVIINGVKISTDEYQGDIPILWKDSTYIVPEKKVPTIAFNDKNGLIIDNPTDKKIEISFLPGTPYFEAEEKDTLIFRLLDTKIEIINRKAQDLVTQVIVSAYSLKGAESLEIENGRYSLKYTELGLKLDNLKRSRTGEVPFVLYLRNSVGTPVITKDGEEARLIFNNKGEYFYLNGEIINPLECISCLQLSLSSRETLTLATKHIQSLSGFENIKITAENPRDVLFLSHYLEDVPPEYRSEIAEIRIVPWEDLQKIGGEMGLDSGHDGIAVKDGNIIYLAENYVGSYLVVHEAAHIHQYNLPSKKEIEFAIQWEFVANPNSQSLNVRSTTWEDGSSGPREGYVSAYAASGTSAETYEEKVAEDVAETTAVAISNPEFLRSQELIRPLVLRQTEQSTYIDLYNNPQYINEPILATAGGFDQRYEQKIELLLKYGFITQKTYDEVMGIEEKQPETKPPVAEGGLLGSG